MRRARLSLVLLTCSVVGCAANRANLADDSAAATPPAAATAPAATVATATAPAAAGQPGATTVVDGNVLAARAAMTPICRDVLRRGSNVHVTECRTAEQWRLYQRAEAQAAGELVRRMQRGGLPDDAFSGGPRRR
jgi:hypothetical protein